MMTTSAACEQLADRIIRAMWRGGKSFSPSSRQFGATLMIGHFLREAHLDALKEQAYFLDFSIGTKQHALLYPNLVNMYLLMGPFLISMQVATQDEVARLQEQATQEMAEPGFRGGWFLRSVWGSKPKLV